MFVWAIHLCRLWVKDVGNDVCKHKMGTEGLRATCMGWSAFGTPLHPLLKSWVPLVEFVHFGNSNQILWGRVHKNTKVYFNKLFVATISGGVPRNLHQTYSMLWKGWTGGSKLLHPVRDALTNLECTDFGLILLITGWTIINPVRDALINYSTSAGVLSLWASDSKWRWV